MNWLRENRFPGTFLIVFGVCSLGVIWYLLSAKSDWDDAATRFEQAATELNRLERLAPYPSGENLRKMKAHAGDYATTLAKLQDELKTRVFPLAPMAPSEFQSHLRLAMTAVVDKARANKVRLPDKFYLGFDEFASALPNEVAASQLGQELAQIEWLLDTLFEARVDALTFFRRAQSPEEHGNASLSKSAGRKPGGMAPVGPRVLERSVIEATFVSTPAAARKILNQIAGAKQQFFIVRLWHVRNEKDKGPSRELAADAAGVVVGAPSPSPTSAPEAKPSAVLPLNFIVGNEHVETSARIEIVRFTL
ncbi:MAG: hypothetical protein QOC70_1918 [Verrucomicrobiota bacterium]|jgi:hypothetical protein